MQRHFLYILLAVVVVVGFSGCGSTTVPYTYKYERGKSAIISSGGYAIAPKKAPRAVKAAIAAGNKINGMPYRMGGGHGRHYDSGYDCSGATSFVLKEAGKLRGDMPSRAFREYGKKGYGDWMTVYAKEGHVFLVVAGLRFDTGWHQGGAKGPRWTTKGRPADGYVVRHPPGL
ncbi:hypothetical protein BH23VER1_BH23VER1_06510 [soil metagenome]